MLTRNEFESLSHKPTPWTKEEEHNIKEYLRFIRDSQEYKEYMSKENIGLLNDFQKTTYSLQEKKDSNIPLNQNETIILMSGANILANSKKEKKEILEEKAYIKTLKRNNAYDRHGGISASLATLFIVLNLGIFIAGLILMLN